MGGIGTGFSFLSKSDTLASYQFVITDALRNSTLLLMLLYFYSGILY